MMIEYLDDENASIGWDFMVTQVIRFAHLCLLFL